MTLVDRLGAGLPRGPVTLELDDIQATVLRYRPEPYYGTHTMLHVDDARIGREFLRRLAPHVASAADWWQAREAWMAVAISYTGLEALGLSEGRCCVVRAQAMLRRDLGARAGQIAALSSPNAVANRNTGVASTASS